MGNGVKSVGRRRLAGRMARRFMLVGGIIALGLSCWLPVPADRLTYHTAASTEVMDRYERPLRRYLSLNQGTARRIRLEDVPPVLLQVLIATEDKRFYEHEGVDILAMARATWQLVRNRRVISGASTITQQTVRNIYHLPRSPASKVQELWLAIRLEHTLSKRDILEQYLNRLPYGNQIFGLGTAAWMYLEKPVSDLTLAEAAFLVAIPQAPSRLNPYRYFHRVMARQRRILTRLVKRGNIDSLAYRKATQQPIRLADPQPFFRAPHFCDAVLARLDTTAGVPQQIVTTLDIDLQQQIRHFVRARLAALAAHHAYNAAVLVMDNKTGEVLVWLGSPDFFDSVHAGQMDGVQALRQPGSTLKPFTYALALQNGMTAATVLPDIPLSDDEQMPVRVRNYDGTWHGPVTVRTALACSYNVPAVRAVEQTGEAALLELLHRLGFHSLQQPADYYGKGLTLGNGEVTLLELVRAYATLANGGIPVTETLIRSLNGQPVDCGGQRQESPALDPAVCAIIRHILDDDNARVPAFGSGNPLEFPFACAAKTGTSKDYRDNWVVGCTPEITAGVWVGNFNGEPMRRLSGIAGAGPIFNDIMYLLDSRYHFSSFVLPDSVQRVSICALSGCRPDPCCPMVRDEWFVSGTEPADTCCWHVPVEMAGSSGSRVFVQTQLPDMYAAWNTGPILPNRPLLPAETHGSDFSGDSLRVLSPEHLAVYHIDGILERRFQRIELVAAGVSSAEVIEWWVDNSLFQAIPTGQQAVWPLQPGRHSIWAVANGDTSAPVVIRVLP